MLDDLTTVSQGVQTRSFVYDSLKRLTSATNPESGTISYQYDANANLTSKTDARGVATSFSYDALDRVTSKSYSDATTPSVTYAYDTVGVANSKGRLTSVSSSVSTYSYSGYDALGRVQGGTQTTGGQSYSMSYAYNLAGGLTSMTYPSGRVVTTNYDLAGRISQVSGAKGAASTTYASSFAYAPHGAIQSMTLGNNLVESTQFNNRLQPTNISLGSLLSLAYNYGLTNNNGNVLSITTTPGAGQTSIAQTFGYDSLNRLQTATETVNAAQSWNQAFGYDRYGNRWFDPATSGAVMGPISSQSDVSASNNRIVKAGYSYDAAGNMTAEPGKTYTFDGENKIVTANVGGAISTYVYDGDGRRVKKATPQGASVYVYDAAGQMIAEYADAPAAGPGGTQYATADHLGTPRLWTNSSGTVISRHDYLPFGEELFAGIGSRTVALSYPLSAQSDGQRKQFTSKERDHETGLDYFLARYYSSTHGRFTSVDPGRWPLEDPQGFNGYAYGRNNPLRYVDEDGEEAKDRVNKANELAKANIPYSLGGTDPTKGLDCSGLCLNVFAADTDNNVRLDRTAAAQKVDFEQQGEFTTDISNAQPGDEIFFQNDSGQIKHVGIVTDVRDGKIYFVHAPRPGKNVQQASISIQNGGKFGSQTFAGLGRPKSSSRGVGSQGSSTWWERLREGVQNLGHRLFPSIFSGPTPQPQPQPQPRRKGKRKDKSRVTVTFTAGDVVR